METKKSHYEILGVDQFATPEEIKTAYRNKAIENHPDKGGAIEDMQEINEAYRVLSNEKLREQYDITGNVSSTDTEDTIRTKRIADFANIQMLDAIRENPDNIKEFFKKRRSINDINHVQDVVKAKEVIRRLTSFIDRIKEQTSNVYFPQYDVCINQMVQETEKELEMIHEEANIRDEAFRILIDEFVFEEKKEKNNTNLFWKKSTMNHFY